MRRPDRRSSALSRRRRRAADISMPSRFPDASITHNADQEEAMAEQKRWRRRPEHSAWGDYGPDDQLGRMNELPPAKVKQGIAEVKEGKPFCLSMPLDYPGGNVLNPRRHPPQLRPSLRDDRSNWLYRTEWSRAGLIDVVNDDLVIMHLQ